jgi:hypothetical protein
MIGIHGISSKLTAAIKFKNRESIAAPSFSVKAPFAQPPIQGVVAVATPVRILT